VLEVGKATELVMYDDGLLQGSEHVVIFGCRRFGEVGRALQGAGPRVMRGPATRSYAVGACAYYLTFAQSTQA
jgi:hypothetical protein